MRESAIGIDWQQGVSEGQPAGPDMQYTPEFAQLEAAAAGSSEQQYGAVVVAARGPDWQRVFELALALSGKTRDLRVLLLLNRALTRLRGLPGLLDGLQAVHAVLHRHWNEVHPQLSVDGLDDPQIRFAVLSGFADPHGLALDLRQAVALHSPLGVFSLRDLERAEEHGSVEAHGVSVERARLQAMAREPRPPGLGPDVQLPGQLLALLNELLQDIGARLGPDHTPDWSRLCRPLERASRLLGRGLAPSAPDGPWAPSAPDGPWAPSALQPGNALPGSGVAAAAMLHSRADVARAMDSICAYLEQHEPTNPAPLLVRRARRLMDMGFLDIVRDMAPDGVNQVLFVAGAEAEGDGQSS